MDVIRHDYEKMAVPAGDVVVLLDSSSEDRWSVAGSQHRLSAVFRADGDEEDRAVFDPIWHIVG